MDAQVRFPCQLVHPGLLPLFRRDPQVARDRHAFRWHARIRLVARWQTAHSGDRASAGDPRGAGRGCAGRGCRHQRAWRWSSRRS